MRSASPFPAWESTSVMSSIAFTSGIGSAACADMGNVGCEMWGHVTASSEMIFTVQIASSFPPSVDSVKTTPSVGSLRCTVNVSSFS